MNITPPDQSPQDGSDPTSSAPKPFVLSRRTFAGGAALAAAGFSLFGALPTAAASGAKVPSAGPPGALGPSGVGSVSTAPRLPRDFGRTFTSQWVRANGIRQHVVIGGVGPPLLLVHGWPENWYAWRLLMPTLAQSFTVIAVDQRGIGLTDKPRDGYDTATLANDLVALMDALGHDRFAVIGHDTGYIISYALAADHRDRVERLVVAEIPGPPGVGPKDHQPPLFIDSANNDRLWHIPFNRVDNDLILDMVSSNADAYYRYEYTIQGGPALPDYAIKYYIKLFTRDRDVLRGSFGLYRAWDAHLAQNAQREAAKLTIPVLGIGGEQSWGMMAGDAMRAVADDVQTATIPGAGHWVAEQAPEAMLDVISAFLAPYAAS